MNKSVCQIADEIVSGERRSTYGHPVKNFTETANILNAMGFSFQGRNLEPEDVGMMMIGVKLARQLNKNTKDNIVDLIGYAKCIDLIHQHKEESTKIG